MEDEENKVSDPIRDLLELVDYSDKIFKEKKWLQDEKERRDICLEKYNRLKSKK
mgnify:FL=1